MHLHPCIRYLTALLLLFATSRAKPDSLTNGLYAFYTLNGSTTEISDNAKGLALFGECRFEPDYGLRIVADESPLPDYCVGGYIKLPRLSSDFNSAFTASFWVRNESFIDLGYGTYLGLQRRGGPGIEIGFDWYSNLIKYYSYPVNPRYPNAAFIPDATFTVPVSRDDLAHWRQVAFTYNAGLLTCYFNGTNIGSAEISTNLFPASSAILGSFYSQVAADSARMSATFANLRLYNRSLSATEIARLYVKDRPTFAPFLAPNNIQSQTLLCHAISASDFDPYDYNLLLLPSGTGLTCRLIEFDPFRNGFTQSTNTYSWSASGSNASLVLTSPTLGKIVAHFALIAPDAGNYQLSNATSEAWQSGTFQFFTNMVPPSISNATVFLHAKSGQYPFASSGRFLFQIPGPAPDRYSINPLCGSGAYSWGTYGYHVLNSTCGSITLNDSIGGDETIYLMLSDHYLGNYLADAGDHGYQVGTLLLVQPSITVESNTLSHGILHLGGVANDNLGVTNIQWLDADLLSHYMVRGITQGTTQWGADIPVAPGTNFVTLTVGDAIGQQTTKLLTITNLTIYLTNQPVLRITRKGSSVLIRWPTTYFGFSLQASRFPRNGFSAVQSNISTLDDCYFVTNSSPSLQMYYRLVK